MSENISTWQGKTVTEACTQEVIKHCTNLIRNVSFRLKMSALTHRASSDPSCPIRISYFSGLRIKDLCDDRKHKGIYTWTAVLFVFIFLLFSIIIECPPPLLTVMSVHAVTRHGCCGWIMRRGKSSCHTESEILLFEWLPLLEQPVDASGNTCHPLWQQQLLRVFAVHTYKQHGQRRSILAPIPNLV